MWAAKRRLGSHHVGPFVPPQNPSPPPPPPVSFCLRRRDQDFEHSFQPTLATNNSRQRGRNADRDYDGNRSQSVHERLYRSSEKQREKNQDDIDNEYAKSRIAMERRPAEDGDGRESGYFSVEDDEYYGFGDEREASPPRVATQRTNALYLEVCL